MIYAGIDAGSRAIKIILLDAADKKVLAQGAMNQGVEQDKLSIELFNSLLKASGIKGKDVKKTVATGYGRNIIRIADTTITEITCQAAGVHHLVPDVKTIIDIGGQDSKLLRLDDSGKVRDFAMNDRCAAGTGRFLEVVAERLGIRLESLGQMAAKSKKLAVISSMCVVFAETEIIGLLATGETRENIVAGVQASMSTRIRAMAGSKLDLPIVFTGGVAKVPGMEKALKAALGQRITVSPYPQMTCALGAALLASKGFDSKE